MIEQKIQEIVKETLGISAENVTLDADIRKDLDADSIDIVEMMLSLESEFDIKFDGVEASAIVTVQDVIDCVNSLMKK